MRPAVLLLPLTLGATTCARDESAPPAIDPSIAFTYSPEGCGYRVAMHVSRGSSFLPDGEGVGLEPTPARVRLGLGGDLEPGSAARASPSTSVAFLWDTDVETLGTSVRLGASPSELTRRAAGFSYLLPGSVPARLHRVDVCGLAPDTTYSYQVGGGPPGAEVWSETRSFRTAPSPGPTAPLRVGVSGDSRDSLDVIWPLVQSRMREADVDLQVFTGDAILLPLDNSQLEYRRWHDGAALGGTLGSHPIHAVGGNHENLQAQWLANHAFPGGGAYQGMFYSLDAGPVHLVLLDDQLVSAVVHPAHTPGAARDELLRWLRADLAAAAARRAEVPWIVVAHHRGELSTSRHRGEEDMERMAAALVPLWDEFGVDLVLAGHDHNYERSHPARGPWDAPVLAATPAEGTTYIVCAGAGAKAYAKGTDPVPHRAANAQYGEGTPYLGVYGLLHVIGRELMFRAYGLRAAGPDDVLDEVSWAR